MKRAKTIVLLSVALLSPQAVFAQADAEPTDLDPRLLAKMAKVRAKQDVDENKRDNDGGDGSSGGGLPNCAVNIGNSVNAPRGNAPKEIAVFIKGDVILSNNKCK